MEVERFRAVQRKVRMGRLKSGNWLEEQLINNGSPESDGGLGRRLGSWEFAVFMFSIHFCFFR